MKKSLLVVLAVMLLALFPMSGNAQVLPDVLTFVLSNEAPGYLIDELIAAGYGNGSLYDVLVNLQVTSGGVITDAFMETLAACPAGSEIFTVPLSNFTGLNNPVGINADGTLMITGVYGRDYYGRTGYATYPPGQAGVGRELFTYATSPQYYINVGTSNYKAFAIAWSGAAAPPAPATPVPTLSEWGMILLSLAAAALYYLKNRHRAED